MVDKSKKYSYINLPLITDNLLTPHERIVRLPLQQWAQHILSDYMQLEVKEKNLRCSIIEFSPLFNQGALVECYLGRIENSINLCSSQIAWAMRNAKSELETLKLAIQPWINLCRIDYLRGQYEQSLYKFRILYDSQENTDIRFGPIAVRNLVWKEMKQKEHWLQSLIENVFIIDSLKALLKGRYYYEVTKFCEMYSLVNNTELQNFLSEAKIIALSRIGNRELALMAASAKVSDNSHGNQLVFMIRLAEVLFVFGETGASVKILMPLASFVQNLNNSMELELNNLFCFKRIAELLLALGQHETAAEILEILYQKTMLINDEPLRIEILSLLILLKDSKKLDKWERELQEMCTSTYYIHLIKQDFIKQDSNTKITKKCLPLCFDHLYHSLISRTVESHAS